MLRLLADENIPRKIVVLLKKLNVDVIRLQDTGKRGISDKELINIANSLKRTILTRDSDFTIPNLLSLIENGVLYISFQPLWNEMQGLADMIAFIARRLEPRRGLLIVVDREFVEVYD